MKRQQNTTAIKVKFLQATNNQSSRLKITQLNNKKSVIFSKPQSLEIIDFVCHTLNGIHEIKDFSLCVDNTQEEYYIFNINFRNAFENILTDFKTAAAKTK